MSTGLVGLIVGDLLSFTGAALLVTAFRGLALLRRLGFRAPAPIATLAPGPAVVEGTLVDAEPLRAEGAPRMRLVDATGEIECDLRDAELVSGEQGLVLGRPILVRGVVELAGDPYRGEAARVLRGAPRLFVFQSERGESYADLAPLRRAAVVGLVGTLVLVHGLALIFTNR